MVCAACNSTHGNEAHSVIRTGAHTMCCWCKSQISEADSEGDSAGTGGEFACCQALMKTPLRCRFNEGTLDVQTIEEVRKLCLAMIRKHSEMSLSALTTKSGCARV